MKTAVVIGVGGMGAAIAYGLDRLGVKTFIYDNNPLAVDKTIAKVGPTVEKCADLTSIKANPDIIVSAVPFQHTEQIASICSEKGWRYCDLGGNPDVSTRIQKAAKTATFTDLGLAPGWANIIAWHGFQKLGSAETVRIFVGGLPSKPKNRLKYGLVFSIDGLWNEYIGECKIIKKGKLVSVPALSGNETVHVMGQKLKAFYTKGGLANTLGLMYKNGVKNCYYKTLRHVWYLGYIKFLMDDCKVTKEMFEQLMLNACPPITEDCVYIRIDVDKECYQNRIDFDGDWTAMQKSTGFPTAAVAAIMANGKLDMERKILNYSDVPYDEFSANLDKLGLKVTHDVPKLS